LIEFMLTICDTLLAIMCCHKTTDTYPTIIQIELN
jgi:hypothetical protein